MKVEKDLNESVSTKTRAEAAAARVWADHQRAMSDDGQTPTPSVRTVGAAKAQVEADHLSANADGKTQ